MNKELSLEDKLKEELVKLVQSQDYISSTYSMEKHIEQAKENIIKLFRERGDLWIN
jgi:hypothetical protein